MQRRAGFGARLVLLAGAWIAGVALQLQQRGLWSTETYELILAGGLCCGAIGWAGWRGRGALAAACLGVLLTAHGATGLRAALRLADALPAAIEGRDLVVSGVVAGLPQRSAAGLRFRFETDAATLDGQPVTVPALLTVGWFKGQHEDAVLSEPQAELRAGQRWRFTLRLRRPHGSMNPHGFDYELLLFEQGVRATASVRDAPPPELLHRAAGYPVERLRQRVRDAIEASVPDRRAAGVLAALAVGDQGAIEREDWDLYRNTGIAHLVSISGLHITMFAWLAGGLIARLWSRSRRAALWCPAPLAAAWGGLACAGAYAVFSGWGVPSQRTICMLAVVTLARSAGVRWPWGLVLLAAAVAVTAFDPWALLQAGFWLSFGAVGLLMASAPGQATRVVEPVSGWRGWPARVWTAWRADLRTQLVATIGLTPLSLVFFQQVSVVGFAANLIAIPVITLVITPLALLGVAFVPLWIVGAWVVQGLNAVLASLVAMPAAVWLVPVAPAWAQLAGLSGALLAVLPLPWRVRALAVPLLIPLLLPPRDVPAEGRFDVVALDVGQGSAVLVRTRAHLLVFDAGPQYARESDAGQRVVLPLLRARGEARIDRLVLSHRDIDHVGGAAALLKAMPVQELMSSLEPDHPLLRLAPRATRCEAGQAWDWDGVRFEMLRPPIDDYARPMKSNAMSCVLRVVGAGAGAPSVLLTGDIEREQELALVAHVPGALRSDVLIAPHHGSKTSSSDAFLDAVAPRVAVFQAGYRNRFGHPAPQVVERYRAHGIATASTPGCGAWTWRNGAIGEARCEREVARRYWHHAADYHE
ncbi:DNA internalization-related competence protein ComEC/Rec2 [Rhizobacter fulvus]